jgi:hypothetical protein
VNKAKMYIGSVGERKERILQTETATIFVQVFAVVQDLGLRQEQTENLKIYSLL